MVYDPKAHGFAHATQALVALRRGLAADPASRVLQLGLAALYLELGRFELALPLLEQVLAAQAGEEDNRFLMAWVLTGLGRGEQLESLLSGHPEEGVWSLKLGEIAREQGHYQLSTGLFRRALACRPEDGYALQGLAHALEFEHRFDEAVVLLTSGLKRLEADPLWATYCRFHLAMNLLRQGRFAVGLPLFEARFELPLTVPMAPMPLAHWQGESLAGRAILVRVEQGFGDVFMGVRYAQVLAERGARVYLEALTGCAEVLATAAGVTALLSPGVNVLPSGTVQAPIVSLPWLCGASPATIPAAVPYLKVPAQVPNREGIAADLAAAPPGRRLGLVWAGNPGHLRDRERSLPAELLDRLSEVQGVTWVSLQVGEVLRPALPMVELAPRLRDWSDTAYALSQLDGLIAVDTGTVHLAGALGLPVWLLLPWVPDWRWGMDTDRSPWYPTMELWRQPAPGAWREVVDQLVVRLNATGFP